jgi:hypothetical protein
MSHTDPLPPPAAGATPAAHGAWDVCDHCQAPLDERQRYCVVCGARRPAADDPVAQYFVTNARRARAATAAPQAAAAGPPRSSRSNLALAIVLALLPVAAAIGVMVGRGSNDGEALARALAAQKAPVINVTGAGAGEATGGGSGDAAAGETGETAVTGDDPNDADGRVIARTRYGTARQLTGARVTREQLEESRRALRHIVESQGREYVEQQRNLPDQIVIP